LEPIRNNLLTELFQPLSRSSVFVRVHAHFITTCNHYCIIILVVTVIDHDVRFDITHDHEIMQIC